MSQPEAAIRHTLFEDGRPCSSLSSGRPAHQRHGALALNLVIAVNHKAGRYMGI